MNRQSSKQLLQSLHLAQTKSHIQMTKLSAQSSVSIYFDNFKQKSAVLIHTIRGSSYYSQRKLYTSIPFQNDRICNTQPSLTETYGYPLTNPTTQASKPESESEAILNRLPSYKFKETHSISQMKQNDVLQELQSIIQHLRQRRQKIYFITGPTGVGKTELSLLLASISNGEVISSDTVQFYQGFNIASGKATSDELSRIPHYFIDSIELGGLDSTIITYYSQVLHQIDDILKRGKVPIIVGGSTFYQDMLILGAGLDSDTISIDTKATDTTRVTDTDTAEGNGEVDRNKINSRCTLIQTTLSTALSSLAERSDFADIYIYLDCLNTIEAYYSKNAEQGPLNLNISSEYKNKYHVVSRLDVEQSETEYQDIVAQTLTDIITTTHLKNSHNHLKNIGNSLKSNENIDHHKPMIKILPLSLHTLLGSNSKNRIICSLILYILIRELNISNLSNSSILEDSPSNTTNVQPRSFSRKTVFEESESLLTVLPLENGTTRPPRFSTEIATCDFESSSRLKSRQLSTASRLSRKLLVSYIINRQANWIPNLHAKLYQLIDSADVYRISKLLEYIILSDGQSFQVEYQEKKEIREEILLNYMNNTSAKENKNKQTSSAENIPKNSLDPIIFCDTIGKYERIHGIYMNRSLDKIPLESFDSCISQESRYMNVSEVVQSYITAINQEGSNNSDEHINYLLCAYDLLKNGILPGLANIYSIYGYNLQTAKTAYTSLICSRIDAMYAEGHLLECIALLFTKPNFGAVLTGPRSLAIGYREMFDFIKNPDTLRFLGASYTSIVDQFYDTAHVNKSNIMKYAPLSKPLSLEDISILLHRLENMYKDNIHPQDIPTNYQTDCNIDSDLIFISPIIDNLLNNTEPTNILPNSLIHTFINTISYYSEQYKDLAHEEMGLLSDAIWNNCLSDVKGSLRSKNDEISFTTPNITLGDSYLQDILEDKVEEYVQHTQHTQKMHMSKYISDFPVKSSIQLEIDTENTQQSIIYLIHQNLIKDAVPIDDDEMNISTIEGEKKKKKKKDKASQIVRSWLHDIVKLLSGKKVHYFTQDKEGSSAVTEDMPLNMHTNTHIDTTKHKYIPENLMETPTVLDFTQNLYLFSLFRDNNITYQKNWTQVHNMLLHPRFISLVGMPYVATTFLQYLQTMHIMKRKTANLGYQQTKSLSKVQYCQHIPVLSNDILRFNEHILDIKRQRDANITLNTSQHLQKKTDRHDRHDNDQDKHLHRYSSQHSSMVYNVKQGFKQVLRDYASVIHENFKDKVHLAKDDKELPIFQQNLHQDTILKYTKQFISDGINGQLVADSTIPNTELDTPIAILCQLFSGRSMLKLFIKIRLIDLYANRDANIHEIQQNTLVMFENKAPIRDIEQYIDNMLINAVK